MIDVEALLVSLINDLDLGVSASSAIPAGRKSGDAFITVERVGGGRSNYIADNALVAIQCWESSRRKAAELATRVAYEVQFFTKSPHITSISVNSMTNYFDPERNHERYQIVVNLTAI